jgi:thiol-disulfide isomerase/thioredoxin
MTHPFAGDTTLRDAVREYYEDKALSDAAVERLAGHVSSGRGRRWLWAAAGAAAVVLAVALVGLGIAGRAWLMPQHSQQQTVTAPRLVAVQIHADWCPRSPEVAPVFAELLTEYGNEPVLFVTLDITDEVRREQAELLSANLGIPQAFDEPFGSGMIKLIDRESHVVLAAVTGGEQARELGLRIAEALESIPASPHDGKGGGA